MEMKRKEDVFYSYEKFDPDSFSSSIWGDFDGYRRGPSVLLDKKTPFNDCPHYSDPRFKKAQTVFGQETPDIRDYVYSDRLYQWDYSKATEATKVAKSSGQPLHTCAWYEVYLTEYFGKPIEILHILAGVNCSNGYPYLVFGYKDK
jgi:hypothetical protein